MACRICGNTEDNTRYDVREMMFGTREEFAYFQCARCGCLQIAAAPADMSRYYPEGYYSFGLDPRKLFASPLKNVLKHPRDRYAATGRGLVGRLICRFMPNENLRKLAPANLTRRSRVLDVGCGSGTLLYTLREAGFRNVLGVDAYIDHDIEYPNGLRILKRSIDAVEGPGAWDLVMFNHALEHMPDQLETLQAASRLMADDATCLVRVPTVSSWAWEHYHAHWVQLDAPRHLFLHSVESLSLLAGRAGLAAAKVVYDSEPLQFWGSEQYAEGIALTDARSWSVNPSASMFTQAQIDEFARKARELNSEKRGDQAAFYLKKAPAAGEKQQGGHA